MIAITAAATAQTCGDVDASGSINILDSLRVARYAAGIDTFGAYELVAGDVDASGALTVIDALLIAYEAAGLQSVTCTPTPPPPQALGWIDDTSSSAALPLARTEHAAAIDAARGRAIVFGGWGGPMFGLLSDTWSLDLATDQWFRLAPLGTPPPGRAGHRMVADPSRDRIFVLFGATAVTTTDTRVHVLDFAADSRGQWSVMPVSGTIPAARQSLAASFDPANDALVVHGGFVGGAAQSDVWMLPLSGASAGQWRLLTQSGDLPGPLFEHTLIHDPLGQRHIAFGGTYDGYHSVNDLHELIITPSPLRAVWRQMVPGAFPPRVRQKHDVVIDSRRRMFVLGGNADPVFIDYLDMSQGGDGVWRVIFSRSATNPTERHGAIATIGPTNEPLMHGGSDSSTGNVLAETWRLVP